MATAIVTSFVPQLDSSGSPLSGGKIYVYDAGTTTPRSISTDAALTVPASNPIVCDSAGRHDMVYTAAGTYKIVVKTSADVTVYTRDNIDGGVPVGSGSLAIVNGGTGADSAEEALTNLNAASNDTVDELADEVAALSGSLASTEKTHIATGTTAQRPASPNVGDIRYNSDLGRFEGYVQSQWRPIANSQPVPSGFKNLLIVNNSGTPNSKIDLSADAVMVADSNSVTFRLSSVAVTVDCGTNGANGLDAGSLSNSTWYSVWVIYNPTTNVTAGLASSSATSPTMPSGYTAKGRVGWFVTNGSAQFHRIRQMGRRSQYVVSGSVTTALPSLVTSATGTYDNAAPTYASVSVSGVVPSTASMITLVGTNDSDNASTASGGCVAPNSSYAGPASTNPPPLSITSGIVHSLSATFMLESTNVYAATSANRVKIAVLGWEDNI